MNSANLETFVHQYLIWFESKFPNSSDHLEQLYFVHWAHFEYSDCESKWWVTDESEFLDL